MNKHIFRFTLYAAIVYLTGLTAPNSFALEPLSEPSVRLIYFLPNDRLAQPEHMTTLKELIKDAQAFYADEMERHGFGRKTFAIETAADGEPVVHHIDGKFGEDYYYKSYDYTVWKECFEYVNDFQHVYFVVVNFSQGTSDGGRDAGIGICGGGEVTFIPSGGDARFDLGSIAVRVRDETTGEKVLGGSAVMPTWDHCFYDTGGSLSFPLYVTIHELGHAFGLAHDFRNPEAIMGSGRRLSKCAAKWLSVNRFFNTASTLHNNAGAIKLLSLEAYSDHVLNIRFKATDLDGLHQAQLLVPDILPNPEWAGRGPFRLFDCNTLTGTTSIVDTVVRSTEIVDRIALQIMDLNGNITWATFPVEPDALLPATNTLDVNSDGVVGLADLALFGSHFGQRAGGPTDVNSDGVVDIVDVLLVVYAISFESPDADAVHQLAVTDTEQWLINAKQREIENEALQIGLTELEGIFAVLTDVVVEIPDANLRAVVAHALRKAAGDSITSSEMNILMYLDARNANIGDVTGLEHATNLKKLSLGLGDEWLNSNSVSDLSPLAGLTQLEGLGLRQNSVKDISALAGLTNLTHLSLEDNRVSGVSDLIRLTNLGALWLDGNQISDISALAGLTQMVRLGLGANSISDISALAGLTNLTLVRMGWNNISDLSPLVANTGLGSGDEIEVRSNPLSYTSIHVHIPTLQSRGVSVQFDAGVTRPPDVNKDGEVNVLDLILIAENFGTAKGNVNGDGVTDVLDLTLVAQTFSE